MLLYIYYVSQDFGQNVCYSQGEKIECCTWGGGGEGCIASVCIVVGCISEHP